MSGFPGWSDWIPPDDPRIKKAAGFRRSQSSKYKAVRTTVDNITFASKKEAARYVELKALERAGEIRALELQPRFPIFAAGPLPCEAGPWNLPPDFTLTKVGHYTADFAYIDTAGKRVIEDTKSSATATEAYRLRKRHVEAQYGVEIIEI